MTRADLFRMLLVAADAPGALFDHAEILRWPKGALEDLLRAHLVRPAHTGLTAPCPHCDDRHVETVMVVEPTDDADKPRYFILCPESLKVEVTEEMCRGWTVDLDGLAAVLASALAVSSPKPVVPGRFWRLGRMPWGDTTREVAFAVRLTDDDAESLMRHVGTGGRAVVFVPHRVPDRSRWSGRAPAVIPMHAAAAMTDDDVVLDPEAVVEAVNEADILAELGGGVSLDARGKKLVRGQLKAELKGHLTDDILVAAYQEHNSIDKAAEALSKQMETTVSRDKVWRAVKRAQEAGVLARTEDFSYAIGWSVKQRSPHFAGFRSSAVQDFVGLSEPLLGPPRGRHRFVLGGNACGRLVQWKAVFCDPLDSGQGELSGELPDGERSWRTRVPRRARRERRPDCHSPDQGANLCVGPVPIPQRADSASRS